MDVLASLGKRSKHQKKKKWSDFADCHSYFCTAVHRIGDLELLHLASSSAGSSSATN